MRKILTSAIALLLLFASFTTVTATSVRESTERFVSIAKDEVIEKTFYVNGGDFVDISGTVNGDVVVGGGQIVIDGIVNGDLLAAGGTISLSGEVTQDVRIAGGQLDISGKVGGELNGCRRECKYREICRDWRRSSGWRRKYQHIVSN